VNRFKEKQNHRELTLIDARRARTPPPLRSPRLITLLADRDWLDEATKTIGQYWRRKNARRNGLNLEILEDVTVKI
jgi:hypothetical protein